VYSLIRCSPLFSSLKRRAALFFGNDFHGSSYQIRSRPGSVLSRGSRRRMVHGFWIIQIMLRRACRRTPVSRSGLVQKRARTVPRWRSVSRKHPDLKNSFLSRFSRTQRLTPSISVLRGSAFLSSYCFPQFANASSGVDLGFSLTIKAGTVPIFSRHTVLFQANTHKQSQFA
jgi:hypothetical protein